MSASLPYLIYGTSGQARVAATAILPHAEVAGFVVGDEIHTPGERLCNRPVYALSEIRQALPPERCVALVAVSYRQMNVMRRQRSEELRAMGYRLASFVSPRAWVAQDVEVGENCLILDGVSIHSEAKIGEGTFISSGAVIGHDCCIGAYNWIGSGSTFAGCVQTGARCFFGLRTVVTQHLRIGEAAYVGSNALVSRNIPANSVHVPAGNVENIRMDSARFCSIVTP